jgi:NHS family xanthosine MFS transporter
MNFLQFAVWGSYLTSMGRYLGSEEIGLGSYIGWFYAIQGVVSLFMPGIMGIIADRWIPAQKLLSFCHVVAAFFMGMAGYHGMVSGAHVDFTLLFSCYTLSVAFYMPTLALSNSVAYMALDKAGLDTVKHFPPIRIFGTIGFICAMWAVDLLGLQNTYGQFYACALIGLVYGIYALTLPKCPINASSKGMSAVEALGLRAFTLFKQRKMAIFFIFSMLLGVSLQITNGFANTYIYSFGSLPEYADTFGVQHTNILISLSQISETLCILLIPFFLRHFGIKKVMLIAMLAWVFRFGLFATGNPGSGVWMFVLSMLVYGVAFDFFNISGSLFVDKETDKDIRSSAQGVFMIMTNGLGATIGMLGAQAVVNYFTVDSALSETEGFRMAWYVFAGYALVVTILFALIFKDKNQAQ